MNKHGRMLRNMSPYIGTTSTPTILGNSRWMTRQTMNDPMICCLSCIMVQRPSALMTRTPSLPRAAAVGTTPVTLRCVSESRTTWDNATGSLNWMPISWETFTSRRTNFAGHLEKVDLEMAEFSLFSHTSYYNIYICMYVSIVAIWPAEFLVVSVTFVICSIHVLCCKVGIYTDARIPLLLSHVDENRTSSNMICSGKIWISPKSAYVRLVKGLHHICTIFQGGVSTSVWSALQEQLGSVQSREWWAPLAALGTSNALVVQHHGRGVCISLSL